MPPNEVEKFFTDLPGEDTEMADIFGDKPAVEEPAEQAAAGEDPEKDDEPRKNRRHRRLEDQLQKEREARIAAEARAAAFAERPREIDTSIDPRLVQLYGEDNTVAAKLHMDLLRDYADNARKEAMEQMEAQQLAATQEREQLESFIDSELEAIEDEFNIDITSDAPAARKSRREFLEMVEKLSPKDERGIVQGYADFGATWEMYQARREKPVDTTNRAKEIAARTMTHSPGSADAGTPQPTPGFRGWMKDLNINP